MCHGGLADQPNLCRSARPPPARAAETTGLRLSQPPHGTSVYVFTSVACGPAIAMTKEVEVAVNE